MLDTESTFGEVVRRHAHDGAQADRILGNRFYKNVSGTLSGTQDYMAVEKLSELSSSGSGISSSSTRPHSRRPGVPRGAEAPHPAARQSDLQGRHRLQQGADRRRQPGRARRAAPTRPSGGRRCRRRSRRVLPGVPGNGRRPRDRAQSTLDLLGDDRTSFVLVASPRSDTLDEARYFLDRIRAADLDASGVVVNRMLPATGVGTERAAMIKAGSLAHLAPVRRPPSPTSPLPQPTMKPCRRPEPGAPDAVWCACRCWTTTCTTSMVCVASPTCSRPARPQRPADILIGRSAPPARGGSALGFVEEATPTGDPHRPARCDRNRWCAGDG